MEDLGQCSKNPLNICQTIMFVKIYLNLYTIPSTHVPRIDSETVLDTWALLISLQNRSHLLVSFSTLLITKGNIYNRL